MNVQTEQDLVALCVALIGDMASCLLLNASFRKLHRWWRKNHEILMQFARQYCVAKIHLAKPFRPSAQRQNVVHLVPSTRPRRLCVP